MLCFQYLNERPQFRNEFCPHHDKKEQTRVLSTLNNANFVNSQLFRFKFENVLKTIKFLSRYQKERNLNFENAINYNEKQFIDLCVELYKVNALIGANRDVNRLRKQFKQQFRSEFD